MLTYRKLGEYVTAEPFRPFRIRTAGGQSFEVRHPEMILVGRTTAKIFGSPATNGREAERWHDVSMMLMESIEPLTAAAGADH
jgi:hypothetical protein